MSEQAAPNAAAVSTPDLRAPTMPEPHAGQPGVGTPSPGRGERHSVKRGRSREAAAAEIAKLRSGAVESRVTAPSKPAPAKRDMSGPLDQPTGLAPTKEPGKTTQAAETPAVADAAKPDEGEKPKEAAEAKPVTETKPEKTEAEERAILDKQFREARRRKKQLRDERAAIQADRNKFETERAMEARERASDEMLKKNDPAGWLAKHGYSFRDVANDAIKRESETPEQKAIREAKEEARVAKERADALEKRINEREEREQRAAADTARAEAIKTLNAEAASAYREYKKDYPTLSAHYSEDEIIKAVTDVRIQHYQRTRREASVSAALDHIEGNAKRERERFLRSQATETGDSGERATPSPKGEETRAAVRPVTNRDSATSADPPRPASQRDRRAEAIRVAARMRG